MEEQEKNPFEKKNTNKEIENIISESPLDEPKSKPPLKTKIPGKKSRSSKKKIILTIVTILFIIGTGFILIQKPCEPCNCDTETTKIINDFVNSIKQQIINKGYAEIGEGASIIRLSPYIE